MSKLVKKLRYYVYRLTSLDYSELFNSINEVSKRSKKGKLAIFNDMFSCLKKYKAGYVDYDVFYFDEKTEDQRSTFITRGVNEDYSRAVNDRNYYKYLDDKILFLELFKDYIARDYLRLDNNINNFKEFVKKHPVFFVKTIDGIGGIGVNKINSAGKDLELLHQELLNKKQILLEEPIIQHSELSKLFPHSVNTVRLVTVLKGDKVVIVMRVLRIGNGNNAVDNFHSNGMFSFIDSDGTVTKPAIDVKKNIYETHPVTNTPIVGFKVPHFQMACDLVRTAALKIPQIGYIGWDIAIKENSIDLVEGNTLPCYTLFQSKIHINADNTGFKPYFDSVIYGNNFDDKPN